MKIAQLLASLGPVGYLNGSGTVATLLALPVVYALNMWCEPWVYVVVVGVITVAACLVVNNVVPRFEVNDPSHIVIDEVVGCLITFLFVPITWQSLMIGAVLFRFFDISKWFGIKYFERLQGAWGVMLDDIAAGVLSNLMLRVILATLF